MTCALATTERNGPYVEDSEQIQAKCWRRRAVDQQYWEGEAKSRELFQSRSSRVRESRDGRDEMRLVNLAGAEVLKLHKRLDARTREGRAESISHPD